MCQSQAAAYRATCQTRVGQLNTMLKPAKEDVKKVDKSPNKAAFQSQLEQLEELVELGTALTELLGMMPVQAPDPEQFLACLGKCQKVTNFGVGLGPGFAMKGMMARANEACLPATGKTFAPFYLKTAKKCKSCLKTWRPRSFELTLQWK